jgi:hypothetical protein
MTDIPENQRFESDEELLAFLRERTDDIEAVIIPVQEGVEFVGPQGQRVRMPNVGAILQMCSGEQASLHREDAEMLINDGVLQRLRIKCVLDTLRPS